MLEVLRVPGALSLFMASCVARVPFGALALLLVLHTQHLTGSYAQGGFAAATLALTLAASSPLLARVIDRRGQTTVLMIGAPVASAAVVVLALLPAGTTLGPIVACAAIAGASHPPVGACMRALWPMLLDDRDDRHAAYALESVVLEVVYICGPLLLVAVMGSWSIAGALAASAALMLSGSIAFAANPVSRAWRPDGELVRSRAGALRPGGVRVLVGVFVLCGLAAGAVEVAVPAALDHMGHRDLTGVALAAWGVGSMLAGIAIARVGAPSHPARRLAAVLLCWGVAHALVGVAQTPLSLALLLALAGATIAPTFVYANGMLDGLAARGTLTEAFTWTAAGAEVGVAAGSAVAGVVAELASPGVALAALGGGGVAAALLVRIAATGPLHAAEPAVV